MVNYSDLANVENSNEHIATPPNTAPANPAEATTAAHSGAPADANAPAAEGHGGGNVFTELLTGIGDHHGLYIFDKHITDLPIIIYDNQEGFHYYSTEHEMAHHGQFKMVHGKGITKVSNEMPVTFDLSITNLVFFQWTAMVLVFLGLYLSRRKYKKDEIKAPSGIASLFELIIVFIRDEVVYSNIPSRKVADRLLPYFITLFFFILVMNLLGLVPGGHTATGDIGTTAGLAITAFLVINFTSIRELGIFNYIKHLTGGVHWALWPIMIPIEIVSLFTKPFALTVRLYANMTAGHVMLFVLIGLVFFFKSVGVAPITVGFSLFILTLELLVAFVQAYIFTILTAVFTGVASAHHDEHHAEEHHAHSH